MLARHHGNPSGDDVINMYMFSDVNKKILTFLGLSKIALLWLVISLHKSNHHDTAGFIREPAGSDRSWCRTTEGKICLLNQVFPFV